LDIHPLLVVLNMKTMVVKHVGIHICSHKAQIQNADNATFYNAYLLLLMGLPSFFTR